MEYQSRVSIRDKKNISEYLIWFFAITVMILGLAACDSILSSDDDDDDEIVIVEDDPAEATINCEEAYSCGSPTGQLGSLCTTACAYKQAGHTEGFEASCSTYESFRQELNKDSSNNIGPNCCSVCSGTGGGSSGGSGGGGSDGGNGGDGGGGSSGGSGGGGSDGGNGGDGGGGDGGGDETPTPPPANENGQVSFYATKDFGCGNPSVTVSGHGTRSITHYHTDGITQCGVTGTATFTLPPGNYSMSASCGDIRWGPTDFSINSNSCLMFELR